MRPLADVLESVIALGVEVMARPLSMSLGGRRARQRELHEELCAWALRPEEFTRATAGAIALLWAIGEHWSATERHDRVLEQMWLAQAGSLLPIVRYECGVARENARRERAEA